MTTDMTKGSPAKLLWKFAIPMLISVIFQQLYNIADSIIAGNFINKEALAAVGASFPITMIFISIGTGANVGCTVIISQYFGAKQYAEMKTAIFTSIFSVLGLGAILTVIGSFMTTPLLRLLETPDNILSDAELYLNVYVWGLTFLFLYNICTGIFTALGNSITPLIFLIVSSVSNVILDYVFVVYFEMGVSGVAWATFICQGVCAVVALIVLFIRLSKIKAENKHKLFSGTMLKTVSTIAIPSILQQSFVSVGNIFVQGIVNGFGDNAVAGFAAAVKLNVFAISCVSTVCNSISSFAAQNAGAGDIKRIKQGFKNGLLIVAIVTAPFMILFLMFPSRLIGIFMDSEAADNLEAIAIGAQFIKIVVPFYAAVAIKLSADAILRGTASMREFMIATFADLILRVIFAYILSPHFGVTGVWMSWPIGWVIASAMSLAYYVMGHWKKIVEDGVMQKQ
ncbi:MAG: MATE family efflux transporter [Oscillospiraceae bacterium]|nr:MATE family efflux transporter [Oscillospiraceae bacterium]